MGKIGEGERDRSVNEARENGRKLIGRDVRNGSKKGEGRAGVRKSGN